MILVGASLLASCEPTAGEPIWKKHSSIYYGGPYFEQPTAYQQGIIDQLKSQGVDFIQVGETINLVFSSDQLFLANSANIQDTAKPLLKLTARLIRSYDTTDISVRAYSDTPGTMPPKTLLTVRQAEVVAKRLWEAGVDTRLMSSQGKGVGHPIASNLSDAGQASNRRVEIVFRYHPAIQPYD